MTLMVLAGRGIIWMLSIAFYVRSSIINDILGLSARAE